MWQNLIGLDVLRILSRNSIGIRFRILSMFSSFPNIKKNNFYQESYIFLSPVLTSPPRPTRDADLPDQEYFESSPVVSLRLSLITVIEIDAKPGPTQRSPSRVLYIRKLACSVTTVCACRFIDEITIGTPNSTLLFSLQYLLQHIISQYGPVVRTVILRPKNEVFIRVRLAGALLRDPPVRIRLLIVTFSSRLSSKWKIQKMPRRSMNQDNTRALSSTSLS